MAHQGDSSGGNMGRLSNPSGYFTPSFPAPATFGAQSGLAFFQENQFDPSIGATAPQLGHPSAADTLLVPQAEAPQTFHFQPESQPHMTMPHQAGVPNAMALQYFSGAVAVQPMHDMELAARVPAPINTLLFQPFLPNYDAHGWSSQAQPSPPPQQAPPAPRYAAPAVVADGYAGSTSWARPMLAPSDWPGSWAPPVQQPGAGGQMSWAPDPVQQPAGGGQTIWAPPPVQQPGGQASLAWEPPAQQHPAGMPAASPGSGSVQAQPPRATTGKKTFEEFLLEAGVLDEQSLDKIFLDEVAEEMHGDEQAELGHPVERDDGWVSFGDVLLALGAVSGSSSGAGPRRRSTHQVRMSAQEAALGAGTSTTGGGRRDDQAAAAAAEARERRTRRMGKRKETAARHDRPDKHAAPRGSQNGP